MSNFTHHQQKWNKFTQIFVMSTNSPTTHPVFTHLTQGVFGDEEAAKVCSHDMEPRHGA